MLNKCATKDCDHRFKYFGVGLLYARPRRSRISSAKNALRGRAQDLELFWLCEDCARLETEITLKSLPVIVGPTARRTA